jgi:hypothetical protein
VMGFSFSDVKHSTSRNSRYIVAGIDRLLLRYVECGMFKNEHDDCVSSHWL